MFGFRTFTVLLFCVVTHCGIGFIEAWIVAYTCLILLNLFQVKLLELDVSLDPAPISESSSESEAPAPQVQEKKSRGRKPGSSAKKSRLVKLGW